MPQPRFLSVAVFEMRISRAQAWQISEAALKYRNMGIDPARSGELAVEMGLLTNDAVDWILRQLERYITENKSLDDPLAHPPKRVMPPAPITRVTVAAGISILVMLAAAWALSNHNLGVVAGVASIVAAVWLALTSIVPELIGGHIVWRSLVPWLTLLLSPLSWGYAVYIAYYGFGSAMGIGANLSNPWRRFFTSAILLACTSFVFFVTAKWRHFEIWFLKARIELTRGLVTKAQIALTAQRSAGSEVDFIKDQAKEVLKQTARVVTLNPWDRALRWLAFWALPIGAVSLWYLEPDDRTSSEGAFNILLYSAPGAPEEVIEAFELIKRNHHPVRLNEGRYQRALESCRVTGKFNAQAFRSIPDRKDYVSLSGYAFARRQAIVSRDARKCLVFDQSYIRAMGQSVLSEKVKRWLDFNSFAAYPVFDSVLPHGDPLGVLIAFKNTQNGITPEDQNVLVTTSRLLGLVLSRRRLDE